MAARAEHVACGTGRWRVAGGVRRTRSGRSPRGRAPHRGSPGRSPGPARPSGDPAAGARARRPRPGRPRRSRGRWTGRRPSKITVGRKPGPAGNSSSVCRHSAEGRVQADERLGRHLGQPDLPPAGQPMVGQPMVARQGEAERLDRDQPGAGRIVRRSPRAELEGRRFPPSRMTKSGSSRDWVSRNRTPGCAVRKLRAQVGDEPGCPATAGRPAPRCRCPGR